jgi:hypothetical protein
MNKTLIASDIALPAAAKAPGKQFRPRRRMSNTLQ